RVRAAFVSGAGFDEHHRVTVGGAEHLGARVAATPRNPLDVVSASDVPTGEHVRRVHRWSPFVAAANRSRPACHSCRALLRAAGSSRAATVKVWNPESFSRDPNFFITSTCGDVPTNASIAVWSVQADSVQNVFRNGWASSARPYAPSLPRTWVRMR